MFRLEGRVTEESTLELHRAIRKYMAATDARAAITDYTFATEFAISSGSIRHLASLEPPTTRPRVLVLPQTYGYGLGRMYGLLQEPKNPRLQVVHDIDEAFAALGVQSPHFELLKQTPVRQSNPQSKTGNV
jgi:hypothetical protein